MCEGYKAIGVVLAIRMPCVCVYMYMSAVHANLLQRYVIKQAWLLCLSDS